MKNYNIFLSSTAVLMLSSLAQAQTTDYGSLEELFGEPVTEGATGTPKRGSEVPINMTIVTADEIARSGARDIVEVLRRVAGVDVQRVGQTGGNVSFRGRNTDNQRLRVLINGRDTFRTYEGTTAWAALPVSMEEIRQIEVVRGPATALYGANAVTGVINIITYNPMYDRKNEFSARIGDNGLREVSGVSTLSLGDVGGIRLSGGYSEIDRPDVALNAAQQLARPAEPKARRISGDGLFNVTDTLKVGFEGTYIKSDIVTATYTGVDESGQTEDYSLRMYAALDSGFGRWTLQAFQNTVKDGRNIAFDFGNGPDLFSQEINAKTRYIDLTNAQSLGATNVRFTVGYREDVVDQFGGTILTDTGEVGYNTFFVSGLADHSFSETLSLAVSGRFDSLDSFRTADENADLIPFTNDDYRTYNEISVNAGLTYKASDVDTLKLMYARGFQAPSLFQLGGQVYSLTDFQDATTGGGNPDLESAIFTQFELQYLRSLEAVNGSISVSAFYRKDKNAISSAPVTAVELASGNFYLETDNAASPETVGFEFSIKGKTESNFLWGLNYSYADTSENRLNQPGVLRSDEITALLVPNFADRSSKHIFTANLGYQVEKFSVDALIQYKSGYSSINNFINIPGFVDPFVDVDSVWIGNLAAHYQLTNNVKLSLVGEGLFDKFRQDTPNASLSAQRRVWANVSVSF